MSSRAAVEPSPFRSLMSAPVVCLSPSFASTSPESVSLIESAGGEVVWQPGGPEDWPSRAASVLSDAAALIVGTQPVDARVLEAAPELTIVSKHGAGVDNIDIDAASRAGIVVTNAPGANAPAVAELVLGLMLGLARGIVLQDRRVRAGRWEFTVGKALEEATLGIIGMGRIGRLVAARAAGFGMHLLAYDVAAVGSGEDGVSWTPVDLDTLLAESDFVSVHVPLLEETRGMIGAEALSRMRPSAFLVNAARGGVVDEAALDRALAEGQIAGAAMDVFEREPLEPSHPLVSHDDRTILTPHMGAYTDRALAVTSEVTARNIAAALGGEWPPDAINRPGVWRGGRGDR